MLPPTAGADDGEADDRAGDGDDGDTDPNGTGTSTEKAAGGHRAATRRRWASLLRRVFQRNALVCPSCQGPRRILAAITEREPIDKILNHLGLSTDVPVVEKARPPPQCDFAFDRRLIDREDRPKRSPTFDPQRRHALAASAGWC